MAVLGWRHRWLGDDGLIYSRVVRQITAGNGPVFNIGERVETSTGTLWQWLLTICALATNSDPAMIAVVAGCVFTTAGVVVALDAARTLHRPTHLLVPAGVLVLLPVQAMWDYSTSGLETGLAFFWLALCWWLLVRARHGASTRAGAATALCFGLGPLVRPDLALVTAVFTVAFWWLTRPKLKSAVTWIAIGSALPVAYEIFRAGYYGLLVPQPAITKEASWTLWSRGLFYLKNFVEPYHLWIPLMLVAVLAVEVADRTRHRPDRSRTTVVAVAPVAAGLLSSLFVTKVGGDFMHGRMLLPSLFLIVLPVFLIPLTRTTLMATTALAVWATMCLLLWRPPFTTAATGPFGIYDEHGGYGGFALSQQAHSSRRIPFTPPVRAAQQRGDRRLVMELRYNQKYLSLPLRSRLSPHLVGAEARLGHAGAVVPLTDHAIDTLGLAYPVGAHIHPTNFVKAGHEKHIDPAWIIADYTAPASDRDLPSSIDRTQVTAARAALQCGPLAELLAATREPLTPHRFWKNLTGSWHRTSLRIPNNPTAAERSLCR
ncbi:hypothetical protein G3I40_20770 [Streptomyces sp. SID14478]|uniref:hypothetical protein n=1 Tax=Streptomyces sp. SID14478 TaxID=2706073 RepID=UPI0013DAF67A|nr:hypothetical protein [Streptomyces sp. SID14478]NEB77626.1 hypothetical protein [Streptomyces sp. SID14478]